MKIYSIKQTSPWLSVTIMLITIFSGLGFLLILKDIEILPAAGGLPVFICIAGLFWISFKLTRRSGSAETEITINDEGIQQIWKSQYLFSNKPDRRINWEEISEYLYQPESNYHLLKIKLLSGKTIKIYHSIWDHGKDDFSQLHIDFAEKIDQLNKRENKLDIKKGKNMYDKNGINRSHSFKHICNSLHYPGNFLIVKTNNRSQKYHYNSRRVGTY